MSSDRKVNHNEGSIKTFGNETRGVHSNENWAGIIVQLFLVTRLFSILSKDSILNLTLTCRSISSILRDLISNYWIFKISDPFNRKSSVYRPRKVIVNFIDEFFSYPLYEKVVYLELSNYFTDSIDNLSANITHLIIGDYFNTTIDKLPPTITHLTLGASFNQNIDHLPQNLAHLTLGDDYDKPVDKLPSKLTHLTFGYDFSRSVDKLPSSITHLTFGAEFSQRVDFLPHSLTHLQFGYEFNQPVDNLPPNLQLLIFVGRFNQPVDFLPQKLTYLAFECYSFSQSVYKLPTTLLFLTISQRYQASQIEPLFPNTKIIWRQ